MEDWEFEFEWLRVRHYVKDVMERNELPELNAILFLIGVRELGQVKTDWSKEEKQDLMHIAVCTILSEDGYFTFKGLDADGWPHFVQTRNLSITGGNAQEQLIKEKVIDYFNHHNLILNDETDT